MRYKRKIGLLEKVDGYTPCLDWLTNKYGIIISAVFGRVWRYTQLDGEKCQARLSTIASDLGLGYSTVQRSILVLEKERLVEDKTPTLRNRPHTYVIKESIVLKAYKNWKDNIATPESVSNMVRDTLKDIKEDE